MFSLCPWKSSIYQRHEKSISFFKKTVTNISKIIEKYK